MAEQFLSDAWLDEAAKIRTEFSDALSASGELPQKPLFGRFAGIQVEVIVS